ncbi:MAG: hypothetical protein DJ555_03815 [Desulfurococcaceae archaeon]|nr:MAG: hypothetical protein DJ555_03815 [Desulfurococcaceae archaeon]
MGRLVIERSTERSARAISIYKAIEAMEYVVEELGCLDPRLTSIGDVYRDVLEIRVSVCEEPEHIFKEVVKSIEDSIGRRVRISRGSSGYGVGLRDLYRVLSETIEQDIRDLMKPFALETAYRGGVEYMSILLYSSKWVILEGEKHKVRVPWIDEAIAIAHTHPPENCIPSRPDLESCLELLSSGGVVCGIVSMGCMFTLSLESLPTEGDFEHLMRIINRYDEVLESLGERGLKGIEEIFSNRGGSLRATIKAL